MIAIANVEMVTPLSENLATVSNLVSLWKKQFETEPGIPLIFSVNDKNELMLDDIVICNAALIKAEGASFDHENLYIPSAGSDSYYRIHIMWDYTDRAYIDHISLIIYEKH